jgi:hypothetical protein
MNCGETIFVRDINGSDVMRFVAQCHDRFMLISHGLEPMNGYILPDWQGVLYELVARTVPAKMIGKQLTAESRREGTYNNVKLAYPLSAGAMAALLGAPVDEVRAQLDDLTANMR